MFEHLLFVGQVRWSNRFSLIFDALKVLWNAINGWQMAGWKSAQPLRAVDEGDAGESESDGE